MGQGGLKVFHLWRHSQKTRILQPKMLFWVQTTRVAESFELLTRSAAFTGPEKFPHQATRDPAVFAQTTWISLDAKVLREMLGSCYGPVAELDQLQL